MRRFGLIGFPLEHSFSKKYFAQKFENEGVGDCLYELFPLKNISDLPDLLSHKYDLVGLNVTIPYKESVIPLLDSLDETAARVGAVNTIRIENGRLIGFNTDVFGFEKSLLDFIEKSGQKPAGVQALVLGSGGASKAVIFVLKRLKISFQLVSRSTKKGHLTYQEINEEILHSHHLIINTTPLGMYPQVETCPALPYRAILAGQLFYDLVYNPGKSLFLAKAEDRGAHICNGLPMLHLQAEKAWEIWNKK